MTRFSSVVDRIKSRSSTQKAETAALNQRRQELMRRSGELQAVDLHGPNGTFISAWFCPKEKAFYPKFES